MTDPKLSRRYADALYEAAKEDGIVTDVIAAVESVEKAFESSPELAQLWTAPQVPVEKKLSVMDEVFSDAPELVKRLLHFLQEKKRGWVLFDLLPALKARHDEETGVVRATLTTVIELNDSETEPFVKLLEKRTGGSIILNRKVDSSLIAGFRLRYGDRVIDASINRSIQDIRRLASA